MRANPLARSYRVDKLTLAALEATLALYRDPEVARREIPALALLLTSIDVLRERATHAAAALRESGVACERTETVGSVGGGAFPLQQLSSAAIALEGNAERWATALRAGEPAVVGRVRDGRLLLDFRAVPDAEVAMLVQAVRAAHE